MGERVRVFYSLVRALPGLMEDGLRRWAIRLHSPVEIEPGRPYCALCREDWPCRALVALCPHEP